MEDVIVAFSHSKWCYLIMGTCLGMSIMALTFVICDIINMRHKSK